MINGVPGPNQNITGIPKYDSPLSQELDSAMKIAAAVERAKIEQDAMESCHEGIRVMKIAGAAIILFMGVCAVVTSYLLIRLIQWVMP
jgi:hypothetical protein